MDRMNRIIFFTLFVISYCHAQSFSDFGVKMGILSSKYEQKVPLQNGGSVTIFDEARIGPTFGLFLRYFDNDYFDIESEILYLQKGGQDKFEITTINQPDGTGEFLITDIQFDYLHFQTCIRPNYSDKSVNMYLLAGGSIGYLLGLKGGHKPKSDFKNFGFGYSIGLGIELPDLMKIPIIVEVLVNSDLTNIYNSSNIEYKHKIYLLRLGINIINFSQ
jgi:hypothetical protein